VPPAAAKKKEKEFFGDTPNPGKGLRPLHSLLIRCMCRNKKEQEFFGDLLLYPPDVQPQTPAKGFAPFTSLPAENVYRKYTNPRIPAGGLRPLHPLFYPCFEGGELLFLLAVLLTDLIEVCA
jgi:hypothetical protein